MPVCGWGGAKCTAGPGAAGDAATVHMHELTYHHKPDRSDSRPGRRPLLVNKETKALIAAQYQQDPAKNYVREARTKAKDTGRHAPSAKGRRKHADQVKQWKEEQKKREQR